jgi:hypothetical protein
MERADVYINFERREKQNMFFMGTLWVNLDKSNLEKRRSIQI